MPHVASVGTYLPCWGSPLQRVAGDDEDAVTLAAYKRTFEVKVRWEAGQFTDADELGFPPRYRIASDGALTDYELVLPMAFSECAGAVDKGLAKTNLQVAWFGAMGTADGFPSGILADTLGLPDLPVTPIENSCATGHDAIRDALFAVASGAFDVALVMGADKLRDTTSADMLWEWEAMARDMAWDYPLGLVAPAGFALHVRRYLHESPATEEHLAMVAVKNHHHGVTNPKARLRFEITMEQALNAPTVVTPCRVYDCAPQSDGAAALVIAAEDVVDRFTDRPVCIRGVGLGVDSAMYQHKPDMTTLPATTRAAKQAFAMAGLTPSASGDLKAKGHPPGATGVAQSVELFHQLRGKAVNQDGARIALAHNIGGPTAVSAVAILEGSGGLN